MRAAEVYRAVRVERLIAIVRGLPAEQAVPLAEALHAGGIRLLEITANTAGVLDMIRAVRQATEGRMLIGAGTVTTLDLTRQALEAGAEYVIAPDVNPEVILYCLERDVAVIPGAATPTEILTAQRLGLSLVKIFPAQALGVNYIRQLRGPIDDVDFLAVGGVEAGNLGEFIKAGCLGAGLGGSLVRKDLIQAGDWAGLTRLAEECRRALG